MSRNLFAAMAMFGLACLAGCATPTTPVRRQDIDWSQVPIRRIRSLPSNIEPDHLMLALDQPVRLILTNGFGATTNMVSTFFNTARYRSGTQNPGVVVQLDPAQQTELDLVPGKAGDYSISAIMLGQGSSRLPNGFIIVR